MRSTVRQYGTPVRPAQGPEDGMMCLCGCPLLRRVNMAVRSTESQNPLNAAYHIPYFSIHGRRSCQIARRHCHSSRDHAITNTSNKSKTCHYTVLAYMVHGDRCQVTTVQECRVECCGKAGTSEVPHRPMNCAGSLEMANEVALTVVLIDDKLATAQELLTDGR